MTQRATVLALVLIFCLAIAAVPAFANTVTPEQMYENLFTSPSVNPEWLSPEVRAQIPVSQFDLIISQYLALLGAYEGAEGTAPNFRLTFENGYVNSQIVLNAAGQIAGIWFGPPEPKVSGLEDALAGFYELPGEVSLLVVSNQGILASINPDVPLAVGSAFKMAIAAALKDLVELGVVSWDDVITLEASDISLPSGMLQTWPVGTPMTIQSLATLMISISDNTATDALLRFVGRERVEMYTTFSKPMLSTRELFTLKDSANSELLEAYRQGDVEERRAVLDQLKALPLPHVTVLDDGPVAIDVEWYFTVGELANLIAYIQDLPFMSVNPGVANPADWQHVAFKGGSEPGVLNLTTLVVGNSGTTYIISATWNNHQEVLDEARFFGLYSGLLSALKQLDAAE